MTADADADPDGDEVEFGDDYDALTPAQQDDDDLCDEVGEALDLPAEEKQAALLAVAAEADAGDHLNAAIAARLSLMSADGYSDLKWMERFAWCETQWRRHPERLFARTRLALLAYYAVVVDQALGRVTVPTARVAALVDAMARRQLEADPDASPYLPAMVGHRLAIVRGDLDEARRLFEVMEVAPDDDVIPRLQEVSLDWFALTGRDEDAVARYAATVGTVTDPFLAGGMHGAIVWPLLRLGRRADAAACVDAALATPDWDDCDLRWRAPVLSAAAVLDRPDLVLELAARWDVGDEREDGADQEPSVFRDDIAFNAHLAVALDLLTAAGQGDRPSLPGSTVGEDAAACRRDAAAIAARGDQVNGTDAETRALARFWPRHRLD